MRQERLARLILAHREAMEIDPQARATRETIVSILQALDQGDITAGRAAYLLNYQAMHWADEPAQAALYRQAAAEVRKMQRAEQ